MFWIVVGDHNMETGRFTVPYATSAKKRGGGDSDPPLRYTFFLRTMYFVFFATFQGV